MNRNIYIYILKWCGITFHLNEFNTLFLQKTLKMRKIDYFISFVCIKMQTRSELVLFLKTNAILHLR